MQVKKLAIVGVGLMGTAIGLAAKRHQVAARIAGADVNPQHVETALRQGAIDESFGEVQSAVSDAELIVFCVPVDRLAQEVLAAARHCPRGALITDAGSTKSQIVSLIEAQLPDYVSFVGAHPLAGSEKQGPHHSQACGLKGKTVIVTQTPRTPASALLRVCTFWEALGTRTVVMTPEEHDQVLAFTSHLPHLAAAALAAILTPGVMPYTASGFRDATRIASGDPSLWTGIISQNRENVIAALKKLSERLGSLQELLESSDWTGLKGFLDQAKKVRDALGN